MILVTGATGTVGRQVVSHLRERGVPVRAVTRDPASAGLPAGVEVVRGDLADPASLEPHLEGAELVFLVWPFTDLGAVAVRTLTEDGHAGHRYLLTGPETVTQTDQVRVIGEAVGRAVRWEELPPGEARRHLLTAWGDPGFADSALATWASLVTHPEPVTQAVEEITGHPARTFRQWAADHASDFRPPSTAEVADRYVSAFRAGDLGAALRLMTAGVLRVAPLEAGDGPGELRGVQQIMDNGARLNADYQIHAVQADDPLIRGDQFAVRFAFDRTHVPSGKRETAVKISLYTVTDGTIVREEVYYHSPPHTRSLR